MIRRRRSKLTGGYHVESTTTSAAAADAGSNVGLSFSASCCAQALVLAALLLPIRAYAAPPANADQSLAPWFGSLKTANGMSCCGVADCRPFPVTINERGYSVLYYGKLIPVPPETVSERTDNPTGDYIACVQPSLWLGGVQQGPLVLCFFRAPHT